MGKRIRSRDERKREVDQTPESATGNVVDTKDGDGVRTT
jgi:hypothetical protein